MAQKGLPAFDGEETVWIDNGRQPCSVQPEHQEAQAEELRIDDIVWVAYG